MEAALIHSSSIALTDFKKHFFITFPSLLHFLILDYFALLFS